MSPAAHAILVELRARGEIPAEPLLQTPTDEHQEVVLAEDLAPIIQTLIDNINASLGDEDSQGALTIAEQSGYGVSMRTIHRVLKGEAETVGLDLADRILLALDSNISLFVHAGLLEVYPEREAREATLIQTQMMHHVARSRGITIPREKRARIAWHVAFRRQLRREASTA